MFTWGRASLNSPTHIISSTLCTSDKDKRDDVLITLTNPMSCQLGLKGSSTPDLALLPSFLVVWYLGPPPVSSLHYQSFHTEVHLFFPALCFEFSSVKPKQNLALPFRVMFITQVSQATVMYCVTLHRLVTWTQHKHATYEFLAQNEQGHYYRCLTRTGCARVPKQSDCF